MFYDTSQIFLLGTEYDTTEACTSTKLLYLKQNPSEQHLTIDELQKMIATNSSAALMTKMSRCVGNITGTNVCWGKVKEDLKSVILHAGPQTFFFTFSSADMHSPELHSLFVLQTLKLIHKRADKI